ncbi:VCBS repeat-containing protein [Mumia sp. zg.B53]|uniref:FG-GAP repeat domain-containing protein n=1 Tax=unclassified Mumia TaxID=2621872 RepID=UPI001C6F19B7|nr:MULTISPECIES: VCBS repeat-containing protein [unclassified Mumia]MBW9209977.1 VCBS repeat-containing protein [Mumia sp. zg.B21]MBW9214581.1 VCBS repeat-containing protein [Mumia sp. zg.B53]
MRTPARTTATAVALVTTSVAVVAASLSPAMAEPPEFTRTLVTEDAVGPAFTAVGDVVGDPRPELVSTTYGALTMQGPAALPEPGSVTLYTNAGRRRGGGVDTWKTTPVIEPSDGIIFPSEPTLADVDGDGDVDVIQPAGYFWDSGMGFSRGSLTWWENRDTPRSVREVLALAKCVVASRGASQLKECRARLRDWKRHDILTDSPFAYHDLQHVDFDGDGRKDLVTVGEQGFNASDTTDDVVALQFFKGDGKGRFAAPVTLADRGGSSPVVTDVDGDGDLDVASAQYFGVSPAVLGPPTGEASFVWFERVGDAADGLTASDFVMHEISRGQGPSFSIHRVENLFGDGTDRWVGVNHTNTTPGNPGPPVFLRAKPDVFLMTPGADPRTPWTVAPLAAGVDPGADFTASPRPGQAAPGKTGFGDIDGDGDLDLAVSGDGAFRLYWLEQTAPGTFQQHVLPESEGWGQAGGAKIADLDRDGTNDITFSSFENNKIGIWSPTS